MEPMQSYSHQEAIQLLAGTQEDTLGTEDALRLFSTIADDAVFPMQPDRLFSSRVSGLQLFDRRIENQLARVRRGRKKEDPPLQEESSWEAIRVLAKDSLHLIYLTNSDYWIPQDIAVIEPEIRQAHFDQYSGEERAARIDTFVRQECLERLKRAFLKEDHYYLPMVERVILADDFGPVPPGTPLHAALTHIHASVERLRDLVLQTFSSQQ